VWVNDWLFVQIIPCAEAEESVQHSVFFVLGETGFFPLPVNQPVQTNQLESFFSPSSCAGDGIVFLDDSSEEFLAQDYRWQHLYATLTCDALR